MQRWQNNNIKPRLWLRSDDITGASPALTKLLSLTAQTDIPLILATIPQALENDPQACDTLHHSLAINPKAQIAQHGITHINHAPQSGQKSEFPSPLSPKEFHTRKRQLEQSRQKLQQHFAKKFLNVFVPPWNRMDPRYRKCLDSIGFTGLSMRQSHKLITAPNMIIPRTISSNITAYDTHLDAIDWKGLRMANPTQSLNAELLIGDLIAWLHWQRTQLTNKQTQNSKDCLAPIGILLHHEHHDHCFWTLLERLIQTTINSGASWVQPFAH